MTASALTAAQKLLIEPLLFSGRTTAYVARQTGLDPEAIEQWRAKRYLARRVARNDERKAQRAAQGKASRRAKGSSAAAKPAPEPLAPWRSHPADAPLTQEQRDYLEPLIVKATTTAAIARQTGLPAAVVGAWRKQRGRLARIERKRLERRSREAVLGRSGAQASDRLLAALTAHMPPAENVFAPLGRVVGIRREMAA